MALSVVSIFIDRALVNFYYIQLTKLRKQLIKIITFYWFYFSQRIVIVIFRRYPNFFFFFLRFNRLSHFITRIRQLLDHNSITRLSSLLWLSSWMINRNLSYFRFSLPPLYPSIKGDVSFYRASFSCLTNRQSIALPSFFSSKFFPRINFLILPASIKLNGNMKLYYIRYYTNYRGSYLISLFISSIYRSKKVLQTGKWLIG